MALCGPGVAVGEGDVLAEGDGVAEDVGFGVGEAVDCGGVGVGVGVLVPLPPPQAVRVIRNSKVADGLFMVGGLLVRLRWRRSVVAPIE
ncbi:hypothetical protein ATO7_09367 [Oceanococcus atlanticus]|uniref:Uncharacterized protein n=1 Tax=Oceanococcus atlanticus TaxID=1317117 RepID=A0A1Y1SE46_9GAMM|nr:hypothetical protein ATO7_09367 [Oceanococcus atlanticus]